MEILSARRTAWFDALYERDEMRFAPESVAGWWSSLRQPESRRATLAGGPDGGDGDWVRFYRELTRALDAAGVPLLVGTDTPNPMLVPGYSVHHELEALVRAGLDPARVLRAATQDAADHLGLGGEVGAIEPGRRADLVLLRGDPLEDLRHLRDPHGLVLRGVWWTGEDLEELTRPVASRRAP